MTGRWLRVYLVEFFHRPSRALPEHDIALGAVVGAIRPDGQLAWVENGHVGDLSACSVLGHDDVCDVGARLLLGCRRYVLRPVPL